MDITYIGHSCFKIRGKTATVVCDPYSDSVGFSMPSVSADVVTLSHDHEDHNQAQKISGTARRQDPYIISAPGEYEVMDIGIFGWASFHDGSEGKERGKNVMYVIHIDGIKVLHLGDLGHTLSDSLIDSLGEVDILLLPVGGIYTINSQQALEVVQQLSPSIVIPMHYRTDKHDSRVYGGLSTIDDFMKAFGSQDIEPLDKLIVATISTDDDARVIQLLPQHS